MSPARTLVALLCALPALSAGQTAPIHQCGPAEPLGATLREAYYVPETVNGKPRTAEELLEDRRSRIMPLLKKDPNNFWILRTYIRCMRINEVAPDNVVEEFRRRYEARPDDPEAAYLYAYALMNKDSRKALDLFNKILETTPDSPNVWYCLTQIYRSRVFRDQAKHDRYVRRYLDGCPESEAGAALALFAENPGDIRPFVKTLRKRLAGKPQSEIAELHSILWKLEFRTTPMARHAEIRQRIAEDLKFLSTLDPDKYVMLSQVLREGYQLTGNKGAEAKLAAQGRGGAEGISAFFQAQQAWNKANPYPSEADGEEKRKAWNEKRLKVLDEWIVKLPDEEFLRLSRLNALDSLAAADDVILRAGEQVLEAGRRNASAVRTPKSASMQVAAVWAKRGIALDRVPAIVEEGLAAAAKQNAQRGATTPRTDMYPFPDRREADEIQSFYTNTAAWQTLTTSYIKGGKHAQARGVLSKWETGLEELRKRAEEYRRADAAPGTRIDDSSRPMRDSLVRSMPDAEAQYRRALAQLAAAENRKLDALISYQAALRAGAGPSGAADLSKSEPAREASVLWKELGGTQEGWQAFLDSLTTGAVGTAGATPGAGRWSAMNRDLPEFNLTDQAGKTWALAAIKGKVTLFNVWATWCGPCRAELPHLQKLYDKVKDRDDIQVVTLNVDDNIGMVEPFLTEQKFTFPVLLAKRFVDNFAGFLAIPTNWISGRTGSLRYESLGFSGDGDEWIKQTLTQMETTRALIEQ